MGSGGNVTLSSGGTIALGSGGVIALGSGGNVTLGSGGTIALGSGGTVALGSGGTVALGSGGIVALGSGGNVTLGSGGTATLGSGGTVALGSGGTIALGSGGTVTLSSGGTVALGSGGTIALGSGGTVTLGSGGTIALGSGGNITLSGAGTIALGSGGTVALGSGGTVALGSGGVVALGSGGIVALGSGGTVALGSGGTIALGSGGTVALGSGGASTIEMDYDTANSYVRPPVAPSETPMTSPAGQEVVVNWNAPAFGVVATYNIYRSSDGATAILVGSVSGVNGNPPATTFTDTNPDLTSTTVVYTIATILVPDANGSQRQSPPSPPAVLKNNQSIVLDSLPSSVVLSNSPLTVTATAETNNLANFLEVSFSASGNCSVGSQSIDSNGKSSASVTLTSTGGCTITAAQAGSSSYNAADPASGTFSILPQGSNLQSQTIAFPQLQNVQYGGTFSLSATASSGQAVTFSASGPCTTGGATTGAGLCIVTAQAPGNSTYSAASVTQSFSVLPAVIKVTAASPTIAYGQAIPTLTYSLSGFVNNDPTSVVSGTPALSATATATSNVGSYPITVATGTLTATNYSFLYVSGTLTIQQASQTITFAAPSSPVTYGVSPIALSASTTSALTVALTIDPSSTATGNIGGNTLTITGTGTLVIDANQAGNADYKLASQVQRTIVVNPGTATISVNNIPSSPVYGGNFTPAYSYSGNGSPTESVTSSTTSVCKVSGGTVSFVGVGTCTLTASATATTDYSMVTGSPQGFAVGQASQTITFTPPATPVTYGVSPIALSATATSGLTVAFAIDASSTATGTISGSTLTVKGAGTLVIDAIQTGNADYKAAQQVQRSIAVGKTPLTVTANNVSRAYGLANPTLTASYSGFANGDTPATALTGSPSLTTTAVATSIPGSYPIVVSQGTLAAANYTFNFANGTLTVTFTGSVPPSGTACNGAYTGTFNGNLTVVSGQSCVLVGGGAAGNITETGGNLVLSKVTVGGNVTVSGGTFSIGPSTNIRGNLQIQSIPSGAATNQVCATTVAGNLQFQSNKTSVLIGSGSSSCAGNVIKGNLAVLSNTGATTLDGNTVSGNLQDQSNTGPTQVISNVIGGNLQCQSNTSITGSGNTAASKQGQCAKF